MVDLTRKNNWPELLENLLYSLEATPQKYGSHDCCNFVSKVLCTITVNECDIAAAFGSYSTARGALRVLKKAGCNTVKEFIVKQANLLGMQKIPVSLAQRGDVVIGRDVNNDYAVGICVGSHAAFADLGIKYVPMNQIVGAWHYG